MAVTMVGAAGRVARRALAMRTQEMPRVRHGSHGGPGSVFFLAPEHHRPAGGIRIIYRHAAVLNASGIRARVLHARRGYRIPWLDLDVPVNYVADTVIGYQDLLVVPEIWGADLRRLQRGTPHVVFNQSGHLTWARDPSAVNSHLTSSPDLRTIVTVSEHSRELLTYAFPRLRVDRVHVSVDPHIFTANGYDRQRQVAFMPRRGLEDATQVLSVLKARGALAGWKVVPIENRTEPQVAALMRRSLVFLSFAYQEGFGLPAVEAMSSGCYVVGFDGFGGREFLRPEHSSPVPAGDVLTFARVLEDVIQREDDSPGTLAAAGARASAFVASEYSPDRERQDVVNLYSRLLRPSSA